MAEANSEGGCVCGAIRYRVIGAPTNSMIYRCQPCRRVSSAPVVAWVKFPKSRFWDRRDGLTIWSSK